MYLWKSGFGTESIYSLRCVNIPRQIPRQFVLPFVWIAIVYKDMSYMPEKLKWCFDLTCLVKSYSQFSEVIITIASSIMT